jgi:K+-transporting ATPase ATPase A chain
MSYMSGSGWVQLLAFCIGLILITKPMGLYLLRVLDPEVEGGVGPLEKILGPVERFTYFIARVDPKKQQNWKQYLLSLLGHHRLHPGFQLRHQYRLAKLRAGADVHLLLADRRLGAALLLLL